MCPAVILIIALPIHRYLFRSVFFNFLQGGEVLEDGRVLPELEFWQMDIHLEWFDLNTDYLTGILGETIHPVLDASGLPIMSGAEALRGEVEDYHISGPLQSDFPGFHV